MCGLTIDSFIRKRSILSSFFTDGIDSATLLGRGDYAERLQAIDARMMSDSFKIMFIGQFKVGKSALINAMLGEKILPSFSKPCTAIINEVKWGESKRAILYFRPDIPEQPEFPEVVRAHISKYGAKNVPPLEVPVHDLEKYVVIPHPERNQSELLADTPYSKVELFWPLGIMKDGVEIIDSPGLNDHEVRDRVSIDYLSITDAVIFTMSSTQLAGRYEMGFIDMNLHTMGHDDIFFVCNRYDQLNSDTERERIKVYAKNKLAAKTRKGERMIFFISATMALEAKTKGDMALLDRSGLGPFERELSRFLTDERGIIKLKVPSAELKVALNDMNVLISLEQKNLEMSVEDLTKKASEIRPRLDYLHEKRREISQRMNKRVDILVNELQGATDSFLLRLEREVPEWIDHISIDQKVASSNKNAVKKVYDELQRKLNERIESERNLWLYQTVNPLSKKWGDETATELKTLLDEFGKDFDRFIIRNITDDIRLDLKKDIDITSHTTVLDLAFVDVILGVGGIVGGLIQIGLIATVIFELTTVPYLIPITIGLMVFEALGLLWFWKKKDLVVQRVKDKSKELIVENIRKQRQSENITALISEKINHSFRPRFEEIMAPVDSKILLVEEQLNSAISEKNKGSDHAKARIGELHEIQTRLKNTSNALVEYMEKELQPCQETK